VSSEPRLAELHTADAGAVGAFIGVPLSLSNGTPFGTLCGLSRGEREELDRRDVGFMSMLGEVVVEALDEQWREQRLRSQILRLIDREDLHVAYQPIIDLRTERCLGFEALARFPEPFAQPDWTLAAAKRFGLALELERLVLREAWNMIPALGPGQFLALNVSPDALVELARRANRREDLPLSRLVIEVTEHAGVDSYGPLQRELAPLRARGLRIAVDDAGAGYASLRHVLELRPDIIKVDRSLIHGLALDNAQRVAVGAFRSIARQLRAKVVAEGVERTEDLQAAFDLGLDAAQGYLLGRPTADAASVARWLRCERWRVVRDLSGRKVRSPSRGRRHTIKPSARAAKQVPR
jgi:EAL domain-containing protein (putative c-di-GMP-specific phosphodiesterase class I)